MPSVGRLVQIRFFAKFAGINLFLGVRVEMFLGRIRRRKFLIAHLTGPDSLIPGMQGSVLDHRLFLLKTRTTSLASKSRFRVDSSHVLIQGPFSGEFGIADRAGLLPGSTLHLVNASIRGPVETLSAALPADVGFFAFMLIHVIFQHVRELERNRADFARVRVAHLDPVATKLVLVQSLLVVELPLTSVTFQHLQTGLSLHLILSNFRRDDHLYRRLLKRPMLQNLMPGQIPPVVKLFITTFALVHGHPVDTFQVLV